MHTYNMITIAGTNGMVGGGIGLAVGAAYAAKYRKNGRVSVTFFGDGASNMGIFYESMNLAAVWKLPIVFVCENNLYATATPLSTVAANPDIATRAEAFRMPGHGGRQQCTGRIPDGGGSHRKSSRRPGPNAH
jgi:TPP-dependent pyruvate/acetoin dehydrogenase alpha subunit